MSIPSRPRSPIYLSYDRDTIIRSVMNNVANVPFELDSGIHVSAHSSIARHRNVRHHCAVDQFGNDIDFNDMLSFTTNERNRTDNQFIDGWSLVFNPATEQQIYNYDRSIRHNYTPVLQYVKTPNYVEQSLISHNLHKHNIDANLQSICDFQEGAIVLTKAIELMITSVAQSDFLEEAKDKMVSSRDKSCKLVMGDLVADGIVKGLVMHCALARKIATHNSHEAFEVDGLEGSVPFGDRMRLLVRDAVAAMFHRGEFNYSVGYRLYSLLSERGATDLPTETQLAAVANRLRSDMVYQPTSWANALELLTD